MFHSLQCAFVISLPYIPSISLSLCLVLILASQLGILSEALTPFQHPLYVSRTQVQRNEAGLHCVFTLGLLPRIHLKNYSLARHQRGVKVNISGRCAGNRYNYKPRKTEQPTTTTTTPKQPGERSLLCKCVLKSSAASGIKWFNIAVKQQRVYRHGGNYALCHPGILMTLARAFTKKGLKTAEIITPRQTRQNLSFNILSASRLFDVYLLFYGVVRFRANELCAPELFESSLVY